MFQKYHGRVLPLFFSILLLTSPHVYAKKGNKNNKLNYLIRQQQERIATAHANRILSKPFTKKDTSSYHNLSASSSALLLIAALLATSQIALAQSNSLVPSSSTNQLAFFGQENYTDCLKSFPDTLCLRRLVEQTNDIVDQVCLERVTKALPSLPQLIRFGDESSFSVGAIRFKECVKSVRGS